jgi:CPA2 family monovalent cation:H+ antiporter-2
MKESPLLEVFMNVGFFLAIAALVIPLLKRFKIPPVLGYLMAGILFGPQGLGEYATEIPVLQYVTLQDSDSLKLLSELGIVFLLFVIGLEVTPRKLWQMKGLVFGLGAAQVIISSCVIGGIAYLWGNSLQASVLLGLGLSLSSTAIITQWLHEKKLFNTRAGNTSFSILLFQDLAVIPILLLITIFSANMGDGLLGYVSVLLLKMVLAVTAIVVIGKYLVRPIFSFSNKYGGSEVFIALSLLVIVVSSSIAGVVGLSLALGAFIGGLLLAETQYSHEISSIIVPFKSMLLGIFFMAFGMSIDVQFMLEKPLLLMLSVLGLLSIKSSIIYLLCRLWRVPKAAATESAILLPQAGEFGLLVVGSAITFGILDNNIGQFMFLTIGLTMFLTPLMTPISQKIGIALQKKESQAGFIDDLKPDDGLSGHVVILGYGRMGQTVTEILATEGIKSIAFEKNIDCINQGRNKNVPVYFGDVTRKSTLKAARVETASSVIITIDDTGSIKEIIKSIREISEDVALIIRTRKITDLNAAEMPSKTYIVPEYLSAGLVLAEKALEYAGYSADEAHMIVKNES